MIHTFTHEDNPNQVEEEEQSVEPVSIPQEDPQMPDQDENRQPETTFRPRQSNRPRRMTRKIIENIEQSSHYRSFSAYYEEIYEIEYLDQEKRDDPISYIAKTDMDTIHVIKEVNDHIQRGHWELVPVSSVPKGQKLLDPVWSMKRKRHILTRKVYK